MLVRINFVLLLSLGLVSALFGQRSLAEKSRGLLSMAAAGIPDTLAYLDGVEELAYAAIEADNLSIARNASVIVADMVERFSGASLTRKARGRLTNARVTYQMNRRHPDGLGFAQSVIDAAREAGEFDLEMEGLYELARFQRGNRMREERAATLREMQSLAEAFPDVTSHLAVAYMERGRDEIEGGDARSGIKLVDKAGEIFTSTGEESEMYKVYDLRAKAYTGLKEFDSALEQANLAITAYSAVISGDSHQDDRGYSQFDLDELTSFFEPTSLLNHRSHIFREMERPDLALMDYASLIALRGRQRNGNIVKSSMMRQSRILMEFMSEAIECHYDLLGEDPEHAWEALALSEQMKAYSLLARLQLRSQRNETPAIQELQRKIAKLDREQPIGIPTSPELALLELDLYQRMEGLGTLPEGYFEFTAEDAKAAVANLPGGMLQYATGYDESHLFYVDENGQLSMTRMAEWVPTHLLVIDWRATIDEASFVTKSIRPASLQDSLDGAFLSQGLDLLEQVFPGLDAKTFPRELLIVPDQMMNFMPFAALPLYSVPTPFSYTDLRYFADEHDVSYAYSLRHHQALMGQGVKAKPKSLLAFAPTYMGTASSSDVLAARRRVPVVKSDTGALPALTPLVYNQPEAEMATTIIADGEMITGPAASRTAFLDQLDDATILHLSSHGVMSPRHPRYSFVAFSQSTTDLIEEELIYYNDLGSYGLDADLVVLSACETGMGMVAPGESALTMASAFIDAGAKSVVSNIWSVDDAATRDLMEHFYASLAAGDDRLLAVNNAQRKLKAEGAYTHPFYWGALTLYGKTGPVEMKSPIAMWMYALAGLAGVLALLLGFYFIRK